MLSVSSSSVEAQQTHRNQAFPLVLACDSPNSQLNEVIQWAADNSEQLRQQVESHGAILFRGFPLRGYEDFDRFISAFQMDNFPYEESLSNAVRVNYTPRVFSANEAPSDITICLHHEMAQTPLFPSKLFFFCQQAAREGGATPLCRSDILFEQIRQTCPDFAEKCEATGLRYTNVMPEANDSASGMGRSWKQTYRARSREAAESRLRELGYSWQWLPDGCLRATTPALPAVRETSTGRKVFFNQLIAAFQGWEDSRNDPSKSITFGDGESLPREDVEQVIQLAEALTFDLVWQAGDVALVDNVLVMHGRRMFQGTRKVMASLVDAQRNLGGES